MEKWNTSIVASRLSLIGAILIFINVLMIASEGSSLIISSYPVSSVENLLKAESSFWYRISFGIPSLVAEPFPVIWLSVSVIILLSAIFVNLGTQVSSLPNFLILVLSLCSFFAGGGFIFGSLLGIIGSSIGIQWRKPLGETFFGKLIRVMKLDSEIFVTIKENPNLLHEAVFIIIFSNLLSGLGCSLYIFNVNKILSSPIAAEQVLLLGETLLDISVLNLPIIYIGLAIIKWISLSSIIYFIGSKLLGIETEFNALARSIAFTYAPICLQIFLPFIFLSQPFLTTHWPLTIFFLTNFWMIFALIIAVKQLFKITTKNAMAIVMLGGSVYWLLVYRFMLPTIFGAIPGIFFDIGPNEFVLALISISAVLSFLLGVFRKF